MSPTGPNPESRTDQELITEINAGDASAFTVLYLRYRDWVVGLAYRFTGDRELALDVMQETFMYLLGKFPGFVLTAQLKTFFYPVIRHLAIASAQKSKRFGQDGKSVDGESALEQVAGANDRVVGEDGDLAVVLGKLPVGQREVILLRFVDDLSLQEIATAMGLPLGTVKSRLHLGLASLRADPDAKKYFFPE